MSLSIALETLSPEQQGFAGWARAKPTQRSAIAGGVFFYRIDDDTACRFLVNEQGVVLESRAFPRSPAD